MNTGRTTECRLRVRTHNSGCHRWETTDSVDYELSGSNKNTFNVRHLYQQNIAALWKRCIFAYRGNYICTFNNEMIESSPSQPAVFHTSVIVCRVVESDIGYHQSVRMISVQLSESSVTPVITHSEITQVNVSLTGHWWSDYTHPVNVFTQLRRTRKLHRLSHLHCTIVVLIGNI